MRTLLVGSAVILLVGTLGIRSTQGYPNGPLIHVSDLVPACAGCHSSMSADQVRNLPPDFGSKQVVDAKHYQAILSGAGASLSFPSAPFTGLGMARGIAGIVRRFSVMSSPTLPSPRVAPRVSTPLS